MASDATSVVVRLVVGNEQSDLLRSLGLLDGETVHGSLVPESLPGPVRERLATFAAANWSSPWREALAVALAGGTVFGTPIVHGKPPRLTLTWPRRSASGAAGDTTPSWARVVITVTGALWTARG